MQVCGLCSKPMCDSHKVNGSLPLLAARSAVTFPAANHHRPMASTKLYWGKLHCVRIKTGPLNIVNNCVQLKPASAKLNAQYFSAFLTKYTNICQKSYNTSEKLNNPDDYHIWSVLEQRVYRTRFLMSITSWHVWLKSGRCLITASSTGPSSNEWRPRLWLCVREQGGHFEQWLD